MSAPRDLVVTIGRQVGAGGLEIGRLLARKLGVPFYDRELLAVAARRSGFSETVLEQHDEKPADNFLFAAFGAPYASAEPPLGQQVCLAQFQAVREVAAAGGCVIVGRAADFVLADRPHVLRVFLRASPEARIARVPELRALPPDRARRALRTADRRRAAFYNYFTDRKWGDPATYDLCLDTSALSPEQAVAVLLARAEAVG